MKFLSFNGSNAKKLVWRKARSAISHGSKEKFNDPQNPRSDPLAYKSILTNAVFGGLGLVPIILKSPPHEINPNGEYIDVEKVKSLAIFRAWAERLSQLSFGILSPHTAIDKPKEAVRNDVLQ